MPTVGSNGGLSGNVMAGLVDRFGVPVISTGNEFGDEQIGYAMRSGLLFGVQNATFDYTPPDPTAEIQNSSNPLPFWQIDNASNGTDGLPQIAGSAIFDSTTGTWGVNINPGTAAAGATYTLRTRSFVLNDDNLQLRQKAFATLAKVGTYAGTSQWNCVLRAIYWAHSGSAIGTTTIGTVYDNTTWTGISGYTTSGGSAFSSTADSVDLEFIFTTTATVSSSTSLTIKSLLLATSSAATGQFVVSDRFTASGTWTRPTGVTNLVAVVGVGGGGGGLGGQLQSLNATGGAGIDTGNAPSGGSSAWAIIRDLYVGDVSSVTVGIGTAGAGGTATALSKGSGVTTQVTMTTANGPGGNGGATTFGSYLTIPGGGGATTVNINGQGTAGGTPTSTMYGIAFLGAVAGVRLTAGLAGSASTYAQLPYWQSFAAGGSGVTGISTGGTLNTTGAGGAGGSAGIIGSGGIGGLVGYNTTNNTFSNVTAATAGGYGAGGGGGYAAARISGTVTVTVTGGAAGTSAANSGAGGAGGGGANIVTTGGTANYNASTITATSGAGAAGGAGQLYVVYVG